MGGKQLIKTYQDYVCAPFFIPPAVAGLSVKAANKELSTFIRDKSADLIQTAKVDQRNNGLN